MRDSNWLQIVSNLLQLRQEKIKNHSFEDNILSEAFNKHKEMSSPQEESLIILNTSCVPLT